jgi:TPR repeat protein
MTQMIKTVALSSLLALSASAVDFSAISGGLSSANKMLGGDTNTNELFNTGMEAYNKGEFPKAQGIFEKACNANTYEACASLGLMYQQGKGVKKDPKKGTELLTKACKGGVKSACLATGSLN